MTAYLQKRGYDVTFMNEYYKETSPLFPTAVNIMAMIKLLAASLKEGDVFWLHYSGHGTQIKDEDSGDSEEPGSEEPDGMDEALVSADCYRKLPKWKTSGKGYYIHGFPTGLQPPLNPGSSLFAGLKPKSLKILADLKEKGLKTRNKRTQHIIDDWLKDNFVNKIEEGVEGMVFLDCCHSGTMLDMQYSMQADLEWKKHEEKKLHPRKRSNFLCFSACQDDQCAQELTWGNAPVEDEPDLEDEPELKDEHGNIIKRGGAFTLEFLQIIAMHGDEIPIKDLLLGLTEGVKDRGQVPQICCSYERKITQTLSECMDGKKRRRLLC